MAQENT